MVQRDVSWASGAEVVVRPAWPAVAYVYTPDRKGKRVREALSVSMFVESLSAIASGRGTSDDSIGDHSSSGPENAGSLDLLPQKAQACRTGRSIFRRG